MIQDAAFADTDAAYTEKLGHSAQKMLKICIVFQFVHSFGQAKGQCLLMK